MENKKTYCGYIALIGRPNVGKSTLLNRVLQQKISITSRKPQTTRNRILGIRTLDNYQAIYVDTPGIHQGKGSKKKLNRVMNKTATTVIRDVDVITFVVEALRFSDEDEYILEKIKQTSAPCILVINKIDKVADPSHLLPWIAEISTKYKFIEIIPLSAKKGTQVELLHAKLQEFLPQGPHLFDEDQLTDRSLKFLCAELIREKIFRFSGQEVPYSATVEIEKYTEEEKLIRISALIIIEKESHKRMIIGKQGSKLKEIATNARLDMEFLLNKPVFLQCWCKVKVNWSESDRMLKELGFEN